MIRVTIWYNYCINKLKIYPPSVNPWICVLAWVRGISRPCHISCISSPLSHSDSGLDVFILSSDLSITSFVTKILRIRKFFSTGQKIGIEAHRTAMLTSRHVEMTVNGVYQVGSSSGSNNPSLFSTILATRTTLMDTTLKGVVSWRTKRSCQDDLHGADQEETDKSNSTFLRQL